MLLTEYDEKETMRRLARDERAEGYKEGLEDGEKRGEKKGQLSLLITMIENRVITIEQGAKSIGISPEELTKQIDQYKITHSGGFVSDLDMKYGE